MAKFNRKFTACLFLLLTFAFGLAACLSRDGRLPQNPPSEIITSQSLIRFLNERQIGEAVALFEEGATLLKVNPCLEFFDETRGYSYRQLDYGQTLTINSKAAIKSHLQNLVEAGFKVTESHAWGNADSVNWQSHILLDQASLEAKFQLVIDRDSGKIKTLIITYSDLVNLHN
jgi:hypothetical protein